MIDSDTTSARGSLWFAAPTSPRLSLRGDLSVDVAVIGGGIAGVTTALALQRRGVSVALLEARTVASGVTGCTTAKVSALQATTLSTIAKSHSSEVATVYAKASLQAVEEVARLAAEHDIDAAVERRPAVTYAAEESELGRVREEFEAARSAGLPVTWSDDDAGLPYAVSGAVWLEDQIGFQPVRYVQGLADAFTRAGGQLFENSRVLSVGVRAPIVVRTARGAIHADQVVVATHYPILDRGLYFPRLEPMRSYCVAAHRGSSAPRAMAISAGPQSRSIQWTDETIIIGGEGHPAGAAGVDSSRYSALEEFASRFWPGSKPAWRWSAQDPIPYDHLPMVGHLLPRSRRVWVATGWAKWGLTGGTFAASIIADGILGTENQWSATFEPNRLSLRSIPRVAKLGAKFNTLMVTDRVRPAETRTADHVPLGEARVVRRGAEKIGAYRSPDGRLHGVSLRCTHLGCLLRFNGAERSWDCPCHGSRFDVDGAVLEGPAVKPLPSRDLSGDS